VAEYEDGRIIVERGDITESRVDAVVNAANSSLLGGGGVDGAIHAKGGDAILDECRDIRRRRYPDGLPAGKAVITGGGDLPAKHVIHTVGPIWRDGSSDEDRVLEHAYRNSLGIATETGIGTVAFPAISTGVYGFPKDRAARIAFTTVRDYLRGHSLPRVVRFVMFSERDETEFLDAIRDVAES
jgi:O-acetyl-ADP-ribose deacetylase (regulator of RNase III)